MNPSLPDPDYQSEFYSGVTAKRFFAFILDSLLIFAISALIVPFTAFLALFVWPALYLCVGFIYRVVTLAGGSATLGMRVAGIELRQANGQRLDGGLALLHTLGYTLSVAIAPLQLISVILMLISARGQGLSDHFLGTAMLRRRA